MYGAIRLNLVDDVAYPLLQIKLPSELQAKLESFYMTKSSTNKVPQKIILFQMTDFNSLQTHLNRFNKTVTDLLSGDIKVEEETRPCYL